MSKQLAVISTVLEVTKNFLLPTTTFLVKTGLTTTAFTKNTTSLLSKKRRGVRQYLIPLTLFTGLSLCLSACIPVIRTEYLSPNWQGTLVSSQTGQPLAGVKVTDLYSQQSVKTDQNGYFELAALTSQFSLKLPAASMSRTYQIEIQLADSPAHFNDTLRFTARRLATTTEPTIFDLGPFLIDANKPNAPFFLQEDDGLLGYGLQDDAQQNQLPQYFIDSCGQPLQDAIKLANSARLYQTMWQQQQSLGELVISQEQLKRTYQWAYQAWLFAASQCFKGDYAKSQKFDPFVQSFLQEAHNYLN